MTDPFVQVKELSKSFGDFYALKKCSLDVRAGEVLGLLGPNGAGKSTLIRLMLGFLRPSHGETLIDGLDCYSKRREVHQRLSYLPGDARLFGLMRARGVLKFFNSLRPEADMSAGEELANRLELDLSRWVGLMSTGMRQKLALAVTLSVDVPLLILDEPTANLDPSVRGEVLRLVSEAKASGRTVIFSSHVLSEIEEVCDRVCILRDGELVHSQSLSQSEKAHLIEATLLGELPMLPAELKHQVAVIRHGNHLKIETLGELSQVLRWLANAPVNDVFVKQTGLRIVYDRFHSPRSEVLVPGESK